MKWSTEYPKSEGWYWIAVFENYSYTSIEYFYSNEETGELYSSDEQFYEYGRDHYEGYLFAGPLEEPTL